MLSLHRDDAPSEPLPRPRQRACDDPRAARAAEQERSALILAQSEVKVRALEIERLKLLLAKARREQFGQSSERGKLLVEQLELAIEDLEETQGRGRDQGRDRRAGGREGESAPARRAGLASCPTICRSNGSSSPRPAPAANAAASRLRKLGEVVSKTLECEPRRWKIVEHVREKFSCRDCEAITEPPAPSHPIPRGFAGPSLLAMILVAKFLDHQPLNRQSAALCARRRRDRPFDAGRSGRSLRRRARADRRQAARSCPGRRTHPCRRHHGARVGEDEDQDRPHLGLCARRSAVRRQGSAGGLLRIFALRGMANIRASIWPAGQA